MKVYLIKRLLLMIPTFLGITLIVFAVLNFAPGRPGATQQGTDLGAIRTSAVRDARPRADHGPYPVVLFSHGNGSIRVQSTFLTVTLASHGYVVIAVDHAGNTLSDFVSRGEFDLTQTLESFLSRTVDLSRALDLVSSLKEPDPLAGLLDLENVGAMGHSFGASTALRMAGLDDRIKAVAPQAPPGYGFTWIEIDTPLEDLEVPVLLHAGDADRLTPIDLADSVWNHVRAPGWYVRMRRAGHFTYSDLCELSAVAISQATAIGLGDVFEDGCGEGNIETEIAFPVIRNFTVGFFNEFLRGPPGSRAYLDADTATLLAGEGELMVRTATGT